MVPKQTARDGSQAQLCLYWSRTLTCIFMPLFITGFYCGIWAWWLNRYDDTGPVLSGPRGGRWAYYIWYDFTPGEPPISHSLAADSGIARFVVSAVGIGMSKYGLAGVEAALLMDRRWAPQNATQLMAHSDKVSGAPCRKRRYTDHDADVVRPCRLVLYSDQTFTCLGCAVLSQPLALYRSAIVRLHSGSD